MIRNTFPFPNGQHIAQPHIRFHRTGRKITHSYKIITEMGENISNMGGRTDLRKWATGGGLLGQSR